VTNAEANKLDDDDGGDDDGIILLYQLAQLPVTRTADRSFSDLRNSTHSLYLTPFFLGSYTMAPKSGQNDHRGSEKRSPPWSLRPIFEGLNPGHRYVHLGNFLRNAGTIGGGFFIFLSYAWAIGQTGLAASASRRRFK
jgi:hypothetical protein